jgi:hypothetical protein
VSQACLSGEADDGHLVRSWDCVVPTSMGEGDSLLGSFSDGIHPQYASALVVRVVVSWGGPRRGVFVVPEMWWWCPLPF